MPNKCLPCVKKKYLRYKPKGMIKYVKRKLTQFL